MDPTTLAPTSPKPTDLARILHKNPKVRPTTSRTVHIKQQETGGWHKTAHTLETGIQETTEHPTAAEALQAVRAEDTKASEQMDQNTISVIEWTCLNNWGMLIVRALQG